MARSEPSAILRQIHTLFSAGSFSGLSDRQLLDRFLARHDAGSEVAFTVLVQRHGPMVLGVCRRMLADPHDAEDAFQATFLVLVRKAHSIQVNGSVGRWLFGVAARVAARARENGRRRRERERSGLDLFSSSAAEAATTLVDRAEIKSILAEELSKLPARFQAPVLLCDLEGRTHEDAARRLGWPVGTVKSRLWRARVRLRGRLTRRGLAPEDCALAVPLLPAALPRSLLEATAQAALALVPGRTATHAVVAASVSTLAEGVLRTMFMTKIKLAAAAAVVILTGSAVLLGQASGQKPSEGAADAGGRAAAVAQVLLGSRNDELDVKLLERAWADAIPRRDSAIINRVMADDFEGIDPAGNVFTKSSYMPDLAHGVFSDQPIELDEVKTRVFGDAAVATSRIKIAGYPSRGRMTNVYVKRQGRWQCVASHMSGLGIPAAGKVGDAAHQGLLQSYLQRLRAPDRPPDELVKNCAECHTSTTQFALLALAGSQAHQPPQPRDEKPLASGGRASTPLQDRAVEQPNQLIRIRAGVPAMVTRITVSVGETIAKNQPMLELSSTELADAKAVYELAHLQWTHDIQVLNEKRPLARDNVIPKTGLADAKHDEAQSRLKFKLAKDKLLILGLTEPDIEHIPQEHGKERPRMIVHSPVDSTVIEVGARVGNYYDDQDTLVVLRPSSMAKPATP
jgi:RNA polymerase sigma factor (sigma-70 family)